MGRRPRLPAGLRQCARVDEHPPPDGHLWGLVDRRPDPLWRRRPPRSRRRTRHSWPGGAGFFGAPGGGPWNAAARSVGHCDTSAAELTPVFGPNFGASAAV